MHVANLHICENGKCQNRYERKRDTNELIVNIIRGRTYLEFVCDEIWCQMQPVSLQYAESCQ